jgi:crotonobetainyl-CoA:carnitine CoA-transferase CaiB-like acyl-CoA transferase
MFKAISAGIWNSEAASKEQWSTTRFTYSALTRCRSRLSSTLVNFYRTRDDRWISLCLLMDRWWPNFATVLGRPDLLDDPRYADAAARIANRKT